jgi:hypothetical protein
LLAADTTNLDEMMIWLPRCNALLGPHHRRKAAARVTGAESQLRSAQTKKYVREHSPAALVPVDGAEATSGRRRAARDNCPALLRVTRDSHAVAALEATRHIRRKAHRSAQLCHTGDRIATVWSSRLHQGAPLCRLLTSWFQWPAGRRHWTSWLQGRSGCRPGGRCDPLPIFVETGSPDSKPSWSRQWSRGNSSVDLSRLAR